MAKPIFIIELPKNFGGDSREAVEHSRKQLKETLNDYHVLVLQGYGDYVKFRAFYSEDFDEVKFEELRKYVKGRLSPMVEDNELKVGDTVIVFNDIEWSKTGDLPEGNDKYFQKAKILNLRFEKEWLADVEFEGGRISKGHFVSGIKSLKE